MYKNEKILDFFLNQIYIAIHCTDRVNVVMNFSYTKFLPTIIGIFLFCAGMINESNATDDEIKIVAFGDSLSAGYSLPEEDSFPAKLQVKLDENGYNVDIIHAGVSGDTSKGGLSRVDWSIPDDADAVILELGANDALRGIDPNETREAMDKILARLQERDFEVLLCGMLSPPNMGDDYAELFNPIFEDLANKYETHYYPFFLEGVAAIPELNLSDGIHPNSEGIDVIVERIFPYVEELVKEIRGQS